MSNLHSILVNGVVFNKDKVLVSQRSWEESHMPGRWTIPGGKVEHSEGNVFNILEKNLAKEIKEETGVEVDDIFLPVINNSFIRGSDNQHVVVIVYKCFYKSGNPQPLEDTIDCKWATREEVESMDFPPNVKNYILRAFEI